MTIWLYVKYYPSRHSSLRHPITSAQIEKSRDRRSSLEGGHRELREFRELRGSEAGKLREFKELKEFRVLRWERSIKS